MAHLKKLLYLYDAVLLRVNGDHCPRVEVKGQLVVRMPIAAQQLHLLLDPLHVRRGPDDDVVVLKSLLVLSMKKIIPLRS